MTGGVKTILMVKSDVGAIAGVQGGPLAHQNLVNTVKLVWRRYSCGSFMVVCGVLAVVWLTLFAVGLVISRKASVSKLHFPIDYGKS